MKIKDYYLRKQEKHFTNNDWLKLFDTANNMMNYVDSRIQKSKDKEEIKDLKELRTHLEDIYIAIGKSKKKFNEINNKTY